MESEFGYWKEVLQALATGLGLEIHVCHFPPGTSKWNKIEHRMFCQITQNWRGRPLMSRQVVVNLIGQTATKTGLRIKAALDENIYPTKQKVSEMLNWPPSKLYAMNSTVSGTTTLALKCDSYLCAAPKERMRLLVGACFGLRKVISNCFSARCSSRGSAQGLAQGYMVLQLIPEPVFQEVDFRLASIFPGHRAKWSGDCLLPDNEAAGVVQPVLRFSGQKPAFSLGFRVLPGGQAVLYLRQCLVEGFAKGEKGLLVFGFRDLNIPLEFGPLHKWQSQFPGQGGERIAEKAGKLLAAASQVAA